MSWRFTTFLISYLLLPLASCLPSIQVPVSTSIHVTKILHSTNPQVIYAPEQPGKALWEKKVYKSPIDGKLHSFYLANNWGSDPSGDQIRRMETGVRGAREICLFGAPRSQLSSLATMQQVCLDTVCTTIDIDQVYATTDENSPARLWCSGSINPHRFHRVQLRLLEPARGRGVRYISFHHMEYVIQEVHPSYQLGTGETASNSTIHSTSARITYSPPYYDYGRKWHNPWDKVIYMNGHGHKSSFYRTSNWLNQPTGRDNRRATTTFKGSSVYVYGAPPSEVRRLGQQGFGKLEIALDIDVELIDMDEIYLNIDPSQDNLEVLIYSNERLDPWRDHHLQVRLLEGTSPNPHILKTLTLAKIVVTEVKRPVAPQIPGTTYHAEVRKADEMEYRPCAGSRWFSCELREDIWLRGKYDRFGWQEHSFYSTTSERADERGTSVILYIPGDTTSLILKGPPRRMFTCPFAKQAVDISGVATYPLDVEQAYLNIDLDQEEEPVVIFSLDNIPRSLGSRTVTLQFTRHQSDYNFEGLRELAIERAEYTREIIPFRSHLIRFVRIICLCFAFLSILVGLRWILSYRSGKLRYPRLLQPQPTQPTRYGRVPTTFTPSNPRETLLPSSRADTLYWPSHSVDRTEIYHTPQERPSIDEGQPHLPRRTPSTSSSPARSQRQSLSAVRSAYPSYIAHLHSHNILDPPPPYGGEPTSHWDTLPSALPPPIVLVQQAHTEGFDYHW